MSASSAPRSEHRRAGRGGVGRLYAYTFLVATSAFCLIPFAWPLLASIDSHATIYLQIPKLSLENIRHVVGDQEYRRLALNSLIIAGGATLLVLVASTLGGYALSRFQFPGRRTFMLAVLFTRMIPAVATIVPLYIIEDNLHLINTYQGVILAIAAQQLPLALWIMKGFFDTVPVYLEEASWIDGMSRFGSSLRIVLPLAAPGVGAAALFTFIEAWGDFLTPLILLSGDPSKAPISIGLFRAFIGFNLVDWGLLAVLSLLYMVPAVCLYFLVRRYLLRATMTGAMAGV
ncbi:MAG: carbohydrate ABC transporter permease [Actinomycetota bacterium]|nr:carbohydrate ABC transporter permease [Actinomycetota bacterium]